MPGSTGPPGALSSLLARTWLPSRAADPAVSGTCSIAAVGTSICAVVTGGASDRARWGRSGGSDVAGPKTTGGTSGGSTGGAGASGRRGTGEPETMSSNGCGERGRGAPGCGASGFGERGREEPDCGASVCGASVRGASGGGVGVSSLNTNLRPPRGLRARDQFIHRGLFFVAESPGDISRESSRPQGFCGESSGIFDRAATIAAARVTSDIAASTTPGCHQALCVCSPSVRVRAGMNPETTAAML